MCFLLDNNEGCYKATKKHKIITMVEKGINKVLKSINSFAEGGSYLPNHNKSFISYIFLYLIYNIYRCITSYNQDDWILLTRVRYKKSYWNSTCLSSRTLCEGSLISRCFEIFSGKPSTTRLVAMLHLNDRFVILLSNLGLKPCNFIAATLEAV